MLKLKRELFHPQQINKVFNKATKVINTFAQQRPFEVTKNQFEALNAAELERMQNML